MIETTKLLKKFNRIVDLTEGKYFSIAEGKYFSVADEINKNYLSKLNEKYHTEEDFLQDIFNIISNKFKEERNLKGE